MIPEPPTAPPTADCLPPTLRWFLRKDLPAVLAIERASFDWPWREEDFVRAMRGRNTTGYVAEVEGRVAGFIIFALPPCKGAEGTIEVWSFAVDPWRRRQGVARAMLAMLQDGVLSKARGERITFPVREGNLAAQLCARSCGFRCYDTLHGEYDESDEAMYLFEWRAAER